MTNRLARERLEEIRRLQAALSDLRSEIADERAAYQRADVDKTRALLTATERADSIATRVATLTFGIERLGEGAEQSIACRFLRYVFGVHEWNADEEALPTIESVNAFLDELRGLESWPEPYGSRARAGIRRILLRFGSTAGDPPPNGDVSALKAEVEADRLRPFAP